MCYCSRIPFQKINMRGVSFLILGEIWFVAAGGKNKIWVSNKDLDFLYMLWFLPDCIALWC